MSILMIILYVLAAIGAFCLLAFWFEAELEKRPLPPHLELENKRADLVRASMRLSGTPDLAEILLTVIQSEHMPFEYNNDDTEKLLLFLLSKTSHIPTDKFVEYYGEKYPLEVTDILTKSAGNDI